VSTSSEIQINEGASVRLIVLLQESEKICRENNWPHVLLAIAPGREETRSFGAGGGINTDDPALRPLVEGAGLPGFALLAANNAVRQSMKMWEAEGEELPEGDVSGKDGAA
jgi:hypothetical protein